MNPLPIVRALFRRNRGTVLLFMGLIALAVGLGVAISAQERALRKGSARAADRFDLIVAAPGSQTDVLLNVVYLQPSAIELVDPTILAGLLAEPKASLVAPVAFGDSVDGFSVVGTTAAFVERLAGPLAEGRIFRNRSEVVIGAVSPFRIGDRMRPVHGHGAAAEGPHAAELTVVGRMARTGTPWDAAIVAPVEHNWAVHGLPTGHPPDSEAIGPPYDPSRLPGVPAVVVVPDSVPSAYGLRNAYRTAETTAFFPAEVLVQLYAILGDVRSVMDTLAIATQVLVIAAILAGLMAVTEIQRERFAVLRALGAPRSYIFAVVWVAVTAMVTAGAAAGLAVGWAAAAVLSRFIARETGIAMTASIGSGEIGLALLLVAVGGAVAMIPATLVLRQPVAESLRG